METLTNPSVEVTPELTAQVFAALSAGVRREKVIEQFGLSREQFDSIILERNRGLLRLLQTWAEDESGYEEENAEAIDRAIDGYPLSLREHISK